MQSDFVDLIKFFNLYALRNCAKIDEQCIKDVANCEQEVKVDHWRADLKCGHVYIEVEPVERLACGLGQVILWRELAGVDVALVLYGKEDYEKVKRISTLVPIVYIDEKLKLACEFLASAINTCISFS